MKLPKLYAQATSSGSIDLTLSVNPLGCSPRVLKALSAITMADISSYPKTSTFISLLAKRMNYDTSNIILGAGSEQLIKLIAQSILNKSDVVLVEKGSFGLFTKESLLKNATVKTVSLEEMISMPKPKIIFIANPKTPTGEVTDFKLLKKLISTMKTSFVVIDEANGEFLEKSLISDAVKAGNVITLRTFSKVIGLAGLRIGFAVGSKQVISQLSEFQQPFPVSQIAINLATTALKDKAFINNSKRFIDNERTFLTKELKKRNLKVSNSVTNNLFISTTSSSKLVVELAKRGVSVIDGSFFPGIETPGFRISLKDRKTNRLFLKKLDEVITTL